MEDQTQTSFTFEMDNFSEKKGFIQTSFTFEIDNFSEKIGFIQSPNFLSGGCEWFIVVDRKRKDTGDMTLILCVADPESLRFGWKRRAIYSFILLNQSGKELYRTRESSCQLFCAQLTGRGRSKSFSLKKLQEKGIVEKNKLIVKVEVKVVEVVDDGDVTGNEMVDFDGFQIRYSQVLSVATLFKEHPDFAINFRPTSQVLKTAYMNLLLCLIETLNKPPHSLSETELSNACSELTDLTDAGFKLEWLKTKLDVVTLEWKKTNIDGTQVQELKKHIKNLKAELEMEKIKSATKFLSLEQTVLNLSSEMNKKRKLSPQ